MKELKQLLNDLEIMNMSLYGNVYEKGTYRQCLYKLNDREKEALKTELKKELKEKENGTETASTK